MLPQKVLVFLLCLCVQCHCARILGIFPTPAISHQLVFQPLWRELAFRGHNVTVITPNPLYDTTVANLKEISISKTYEYFEEVLEYFTMGNSIDGGLPLLEKYFDNALNYMLTLSDVQDLVDTEKTPDFDLVIVEALIPPFVVFAHGFNCPIIGIASVDIPVYLYEVIGNPIHPVLYPDVNYPVHKNLNFWDRCYSTMQTALHVYFAEFMLPHYHHDRIYKYFGNDMPHFSSKTHNISLILVNNNVIFDKVRPNLPNVISISGIHMKQKNLMSSGLKLLLNEATHGVIYFSLGSNIKSKYLPDDSKQIFLELFSDLPYLVLWKFEEDFPKKTNNVIISHWYPQNEVLAHPNVKLFITQCGLQSIEESVEHGVPMLGIQFFGDQLRNSKKIVDLKIGKSLDRNNLTKTQLKETVMEIISDDRYANKIEAVARLVEDEPMKPLDKAVWWTEYILRHKGAPHLRNTAANVPWYQFLLLDVASFVLILLSLLIITLTLVIYTVYKIIWLLLKPKCANSKLKNY